MSEYPTHELINIGPHRLRHGDLRGGISDLMEGQLADFIYGDPPWGEANLRYWQTLNKRMTGADKLGIEYESFQHLYFKTISEVARDHCIIEYGERWREDIIQFSKDYGFKHMDVATSYYSSDNLPVDIHLISKSGQWEGGLPFKAACHNFKGYGLVSKLFDMYLPEGAEIVLDPTCGMGYSARAAAERGAKFRGNELNRKRLGKTIDKLERLT